MKFTLSERLSVEYLMVLQMHKKWSSMLMYIADHENHILHIDVQILISKIHCSNFKILNSINMNMYISFLVH